jgi:hypothetical protein
MLINVPHPLAAILPTFEIWDVLVPEYIRVWTISRMAELPHSYTYTNKRTSDTMYSASQKNVLPIYSLWCETVLTGSRTPKFRASLSTKSKLYYDRRSVGQSVLVSGTHLGHATNCSPSLFNYF